MLFFVFTPLPDVEIENIATRQSIVLLDRNEEFLFDFSRNEKRIFVPVEEMSDNILKATIAIEDHSFYEHGGIRIDAFLRALINNIRTLSFSQGGSTITQQVIKNIFLTTEKNIERKLKEFFLAPKIEKRLSKNDILELYLNTISYGGVLYGIGEATNTFFEKKPSEVTVAEAAYLAAIPNAPTFFSPYGQNRKALENRKSAVLTLMLEQGLITREEYTDAKTEQVHFHEQGRFSVQAPHFVFFVKEDLEREYGSNLKALEGQRIHTSLDLELQKEVEEKMQDFAPGMAEKYNAKNMAAVVLLAKTGEILSMVGSRDYFDEEIDGGVNILTSPRQPGSTFKPIAYAKAFEKGLRPETVVYDVMTQFAEACDEDDFRGSIEGCYAPVNYSGKFNGPIALREALGRSVNIPAVKVLYLAGIPNVIELAKKMGITTLTKNPYHYGLSLVLGSGEVRPIELAQAYNVFANEGTFVPNAWKKGGKGREGRKKALEQEVAQDITSILSDDNARAGEFGRNSALNITKPAVAVKTGTTNNARDIWVVGYSPSLVVLVWAGNSDGEVLENKVSGFRLAPLFRDILLTAARRYETGGGYFTRNTNPPEQGPEILHGKMDKKDPHSILHYITKENPKKEPENPEDDSQYNHWEYGVQHWYEENEGERRGRDEEGVPVFSIESPKQGTKIYEFKNITIKTTTLPLPNTQYEFYINGSLIGSSHLPQFSFDPERLIKAGAGKIHIRVLANTSEGTFAAEESFLVQR